MEIGIKNVGKEKEKKIERGLVIDTFERLSIIILWIMVA